MSRKINPEVTTKHFARRADEILKNMTANEICKTADEFIEKWPEWMPRFTARRRHKVECARSAIFGKLMRFEIR